MFAHHTPDTTVPRNRMTWMAMMVLMVDATVLTFTCTFSWATRTVSSPWACRNWYLWRQQIPVL